jgi:hypothetical protein
MNFILMNMLMNIIADVDEIWSRETNIHYVAGKVHHRLVFSSAIYTMKPGNELAGDVSTS